MVSGNCLFPDPGIAQCPVQEAPKVLQICIFPDPGIAPCPVREAADVLQIYLFPDPGLSSLLLFRAEPL